MDSIYGPRRKATDETDRMSLGKPSVKRSTSAPPVKRNMMSSSKANSLNNAAGAADEEMFIKCFEDVPRIDLFTAKDLEIELNNIKDTLNDATKFWEKRVESLKKFRSLMIAGAADYDELYQFLKLLELPFQTSVKDLRSQVVREACITIAYMSQRLGIKLHRFAEALLPAIINVIPSSAKIMSTSAIVTTRFIIQYTHGSRLIPIITYNLNSKSKDIRRICCEFLNQLLQTWPTYTLEKHVGTLQEALKKGISDADPEARVHSRRAYWGFASHFKEQAGYLLNSLDVSKQKMLHGELVTMSNSSSSNSLCGSISKYHNPKHTSKKSVSLSNSVENLFRPSSSMSVASKQRSGIPIYSPKPEPIHSHNIVSPFIAHGSEIGGMRGGKPKSSNSSYLPKTANKKSISLSNSVENLFRPSSSMSGLLKHRSGIPIYSPKTEPRSLFVSPGSEIGSARRDRSAQHRSSVSSFSYQDPVFQLARERKASLSDSTAFSLITSNISKLHSPTLVKSNKTPAKILNDYDDTENLNPEDIYNSLRHTTDEIQKYNFEIESDTSLTFTINPLTDASPNDSSPKRTPSASMSYCQKILKDCSSASQDSGISQVDGASISLYKTTPTSPSSSASSSPLKRSSPHGVNSLNGIGMQSCFNASIVNFSVVLSSIKSEEKNPEFQKEALGDLIELIREATPAEWNRHFREVFKILLEKISDEKNSMIRAYALRVMCELIMNQTKYFEDFVELTILRILEACKDPEREVQRASEVCAGTAAAVLPPKQCLTILKTVIATGETPMNLAAIKMLTKLVEQHSNETIMDLLPDMMPSLVQAYDNPESAVRKAAVFAMVSVHTVVGDSMKTYLMSLNGSKMKLLKLYIEKSASKSASSGCHASTSPAPNVTC